MRADDSNLDRLEFKDDRWRFGGDNFRHSNLDRLEFKVNSSKFKTYFGGNSNLDRLEFKVVQATDHTALPHIRI